MSRQVSILVVFVIVPALAAPSWADDGWHLPKLNPLQKTDKAEQRERVRARLSDEASRPGGASLATFPGHEGQSEFSQHREKPSVLTKLNEGTKDLVEGTVDTTKNAFAKTKRALGKTTRLLMPWSNKKGKKGQSSIFTSWWRADEEPERPRSVKEFLALPRPGY